MNVLTRIRKIERRIKNKFAFKMVTVNEIDGKYYIDRNGKEEEITLPLDDPDTLYVVMKSYRPLPSVS